MPPAVKWGVLALALVGCEGPPQGAIGARGEAPREPVALPSSGTLRVAVRDGATGAPMPARVLVTAVPPTANVRFDVAKGGRSVGGDHAIAVAPGVIGAPEGVLLVGGEGAWPVPPGTYALFITRGPEWEADQRTVAIAEGATVEIMATLARTVDTRGWIAADLHVHTAGSPDSRLRGDDRVVTEVAVGVELIVTTDHNALTDLQPDVERLGYAAIARALVGDEFNFLEGHGGAYPMPFVRGDPLGGASRYGLHYEAARLVPAPQMFRRLRTLPTVPAITINHPRLPPDLGYFTNLKSHGPRGWAPPARLDDAGLFDAIELMNGYQSAPGHLAALMRDWFFLLSSGHRVTALGNSDTHRLRDVRAGFPRTWLRAGDDPARVGEGDLAAAVKGQRAIASNGPFVTLTVDGAAIGDTARARGRVTARITVDAPAWIDVDRVRLWSNGRVVWEREVERGGRPLLRESVTVEVAGDGWLVAQATGSRPLPPALIGEHEGGAVVPFGITNPVFVDGDGDGAWRPEFAQPDPGPLDPEVGGTPWPIDLAGTWDPLLAHPAPLDCEPGLDGLEALW